MKDYDERYIRRCLQLASMGRGFTAPNPMVGAVVVGGGRILGEGFHVCYGSCHAEVNAISKVSDRDLLRMSTLYVNIEPCSHYGKTPPCAELIIESGIRRVVIGHIDPFEAVSGRGVGMLQDAGVEVICGVLEGKCREFNRRFLTFVERRRPYVILKWAQTADGFIDRLREPGDGRRSVRISGDFTKVIVHKHRSEESAIMIGRRTKQLDAPRLDVRYWSG
ncbi:MAG: bifunctional diaminohydroxyphosphoribosylaminopyrimidine deaminase/5-amino-6-(5-phosphoribosylamino)uracil reductase RibD, partial [Dysgonamonadaceae bacterium]|nr:bifunctional diaminohydroxyphosphoribosylaminopyrimidine deaminase/5-amino-6-(5-phosphoribosylamino)uracil reductase RibD [Dysgonamonadaceae bacterium]